MRHVLWVVPVLPGKTAAARAYCDALEAERRTEYEASEKKIGIDREAFFLWHGPDSDYIILYMDGENMTDSLKAWVDHTGEFELWGKAQWAEFSAPEAWPTPMWSAPGESNLPELISVYDVNS